MKLGLFVAAGVLCLAGMVLVLCALLIGCRGGRLCPGPRMSLWRRLLPWRLLGPAACGYDLSGLPAAADGAINCPECGRQVSRGTLISSTRRGPLARAGAVCLMLAAIVGGYPYARSGRWINHMPTVVLVGAERVLGTDAPTRVRREVGQRVGGMSRWQQELLIPSLIRDLGNDSVQWNAHRAMRLLDEIGDGAIPAAEAALHSPDWQRRQFAAIWLRRRNEYEPTAELLRVTVEGLRDDDLPSERATGRYSWYGNAYDGRNYLMRHAAQAEPFLREGLGSDDPQQRVHCAIIIAVARRPALLDRAIPVLIEHLSANTVYHDARAATAALLKLGIEGVPYLLGVPESADAQQYVLARYILGALDILPPTDVPPDEHIERTMRWWGGPTAERVR